MRLLSEVESGGLYGRSGSTQVRRAMKDWPFKHPAGQQSSRRWPSIALLTVAAAVAAESIVRLMALTVSA